MVENITVLSLGAGVQSTAMLLMACRGDIEKPDYVIFADTGWEPRAVYAHLDGLEKEASKYGLEIIRVSNGNIKEDVEKHVDSGGEKRVASLPFHLLAGDGSQGFNGRQCTMEYKIQPINRKIRELMGYKKGQVVKNHKVKMMKGISMDESIRMKPSQQKWIEHVYPLIDLNMNRSDCMAWLHKHDYPIPPKSSCVGCPFHNNELWRYIKKHSPEEFQEAVEFDRKIRNMPKLRSEAYLHRQRVPLDAADIGEDQGEFDFFNNECEGLCGI